MHLENENEQDDTTSSARLKCKLAKSRNASVQPVRKSYFDFLASNRKCA